MSGTVTGLDIDRLEALAEQKSAGAWSVPPSGPSCDYVAALTNAAPSLLAAARAVQRIEAMVTMWEADEQEHLDRFGQHIPCSLATVSEAVRAALGTEQEGQR